MEILDRANSLSVPKSRGLGAGDLLREVIEQVDKDDVKAHAGNLAYRGLFSIFAVLILTFAALGIFEAENLVDRMLEQMSGFVPDPVHSALENQVIDPARGSAPEHAPLLRGLLAIVGAIYGLSALARGVIDAMNEMYGVEETRPFWKRQGMSIVMAGAILVMLLGSLVLVAVGPSLDPLLRVARWPLLLGIVLLAFSLVYYFAPSVKEKFRFFSHGSIAALALWVVFSLLFSAYVDRFGDFEETYGSLAGVVVMLLYMFISSLILLLGAEVNHIVARYTGGKEPEPA